MASFFLGVAHEAHHPVSDASHLGGIRNAGCVLLRKNNLSLCIFLPLTFDVGLHSWSGPRIFSHGPKSSTTCLILWISHVMMGHLIHPLTLGDVPIVGDLSAVSCGSFQSFLDFWVISPDQPTHFLCIYVGGLSFFSNLMRDPMCRWWTVGFFGDPWGPRNPVSSRASRALHP